MLSIPIFEVKNKLTKFLHMIENDETDGVEITRHGKAVAVIGKKSEFKNDETPNPFKSAYLNFRNKIQSVDSDFTDAEWKQYFDIPRAKVSLRHPEDFE